MKTIKHNDNHKIIKISITALAAGSLLYLGISIAASWLNQSFTDLNQRWNDLKYEYYLTQLSLTFITITLTSVLSDKGNFIYWENIAEKKLIFPTWTCFLAYTCYSFVTIVINTINLFAGESSALCFLAFFIINIIVLFLLTINMVDIYYNREEKKAALKKAFIKCATEVKRIRDSGKSDKSMQESENEFVEILVRIREQTIKAKNQDDYSILRENLFFIAENIVHFKAMDKGIERDMGVIDIFFSCLNENTISIIYESLKKAISNLEDQNSIFKITQGLQSKESINLIVDDLNCYEVGCYMKNLRDACLKLAVRSVKDAARRGEGCLLSTEDESAILKTIGTDYVYIEDEMIPITDKKVEESIREEYLANLEPLFELGKENEKIIYNLQEYIYNASWNIPGASDQIIERMYNPNSSILGK